MYTYIYIYIPSNTIHMYISHYTYNYTLYIHTYMYLYIYTWKNIIIIYIYNIPLNIAWHLFHGFGTSARRACQLKTRSLSHPRWRRRPLLPAKLWKGGMGSREGREKPSPSFFTILIGGMFTMKHGGGLWHCFTHMPYCSYWKRP